MENNASKLASEPNAKAPGIRQFPPASRLRHGAARAASVPRNQHTGNGNATRANLGNSTRRRKALALIIMPF